VVGVDIDEESLNYARTGCYPLECLNGVRDDLRTRFFCPQSRERFQVREHYRQQVCFLRGNAASRQLLHTLPYHQYDLVTCFNLFYYLNQRAATNLRKNLLAATRPGGILFSDAFRLTYPSWGLKKIGGKVYTKPESPP